jgi:hypothetical protein
MSYIGFAKAYPKTNNVIIATLKTGAADFVAQTVIEGKPVDKVRTRRRVCAVSFCLLCVRHVGDWRGGALICIVARQVDWQRNLVFCLFGGAYLGVFQYWYQVNVFKRLFPGQTMTTVPDEPRGAIAFRAHAGIERFTNLSWSAKLTDVPGLISLGAQVVLFLFLLSALPVESVLARHKAHA